MSRTNIDIDDELMAAHEGDGRDEEAVEEAAAAKP